MKPVVVLPQAIVQDLKYGVRQLWSSPLFSAVAILTLALGVGANTSIFRLLNAIMLRPLPVPDSAGLYEILRGNGRPCSYPDFLDFEQRSRAFRSLAAETTTESALDIADNSKVILLEAVSYNTQVWPCTAEF